MAIGGGFAAILVGGSLVVAGMYLGEVLAVIVVGGVVALLGIAGFTVAAME